MNIYTFIIFHKLFCSYLRIMKTYSNLNHFNPNFSIFLYQIQLPIKNNLRDEYCSFNINMKDIPLIWKWLQKKATAYAWFPSLKQQIPIALSSLERLQNLLYTPLILKIRIFCWSSLLRNIWASNYSDSFRLLFRSVLKSNSDSFWRLWAAIIFSSI